MKKILGAIILIVWILGGVTACSAVKPQENGSTNPPGTVDNLFTVPAENTDHGSQDEDSSQPVSSFFSHAFEDTELVYGGGELRVPFRCSGGIGESIGYLLILDGQPQPYKLSDDDEYSYMHTITMKKGVATFEFIFTPVTGDEGEVLELYVVNILDPEYRVSVDGVMGSKHTRASIPVMTTIEFGVTPSSADLPAADVRITGMEAEYVDVTAADISGWSEEDLRTRSEYTISVNGSDSLSTFWNASADEPICVHLELWGNPNAEFGVIFYLNNQPVCLSSEDMLLLHNEQGKKLVLDLQIDNSDMEEETIVYAVIVYRNIMEVYTDGIQWFADALTYYLIPQEKPANVSNNP